MVDRTPRCGPAGGSPVRDAGHVCRTHAFRSVTIRASIDLYRRSARAHELSRRAQRTASTLIPRAPSEVGVVDSDWRLAAPQPSPPLRPAPAGTRRLLHSLPAAACGPRLRASVLVARRWPLVVRPTSSPPPTPELRHLEFLSRRQSLFGRGCALALARSSTSTIGCNPPRCQPTSRPSESASFRSGGGGSLPHNSMYGARTCANSLWHGQRTLQAPSRARSRQAVVQAGAN